MSDFEQLLALVKAHREAAVLASLWLNEKSKVVVAGAYKGDTIAFLDGMFGCEIHGYEPQEWAYNECVKRFAGRLNVYVHPYAIGAECGELPMGEVGTDAASFVPDLAARTHGTGMMYWIDQAFEDAKLDGEIDLCVFNMEGYEYKLLPYMAEHGIIQRVKHLVIQFHDMDEPYIEAMKLLGQTHIMRWEHANWNHWTWHYWEHA